MNLNIILSNFKNVFRVRPWKLQPIEQESLDKIVNYAFTYKIKKTDQSIDSELRKLIMLNPWTSIAAPPSIQYVIDSSGITLLEVSFGVISMKEGKLIEQQINNLLKSKIPNVEI